MPTVSDEQISRAREVDTLSYLRTYEPQSIRKSKGVRDEYYLTEHDSLKISNGKFHWFSRGIGGYSALDFLVKVRGMDFVGAVQHLTDNGMVIDKTERPPPKLEQKPPNPFTLPTANTNNDRVTAYLRGIADDYKKDVSGSNKQYSFVLPPKTPDSRNLAVCEAPCDVLAHASIHKMDGDRWDGWRLSLGGVGSIGLVSFLEHHPQIERVCLCLDNDKAGKDATDRIIRELLSDKRFSHLKITVTPPPMGKDYADTLQAILQLHKQKSHSDRSKEAVCPL